MELIQNQNWAPFAITAYTEKSIVINNMTYSENLLILPDIGPVVWKVSEFDQLDINDFSAVFASKPDLLLIGTGFQQRFLPQKLFAQLSSEKIGMEFMNTPAACRTYNLLISEGRRVASALFIMT